MKRIGNFLFVEQWYKDSNPCQAVIAIDTIVCICAQCIEGNERTTVELSNDSRVALVGKHDDNIIDLSKLLEEPPTVKQVFDTFDNININFED